MKKHGFSLVELIVTMSIMGVLAMMAIPSFQSSNQDLSNKLTCIDQLKQIQWAKRKWLDQHTSVGPPFSNPPPDSEIMGANGWLPTLSCPSGGTYSVNNINVYPTCSTPGHVIP